MRKAALFFFAAAISAFAMAETGAPAGKPPGPFTAARDFASAISEEGSANWAVAFRNAVAISQKLDQPQRNAPALHLEPTLMEQDRRYRENLLRFTKEATLIYTKPQEIEDPYRIIRGVFVPWPGSPEVVAISGPGGKCTGTLIRDDAVLTAAHCVCANVSDEVRFGDSVSAPRATIAVDKTKTRLRAKCGESTVGNDLAILVLAGKAPDGTKPALIAPPAMIDSAFSLEIVGFGLTEKGKSGTKMKAPTIMTSPRCDGKVENLTDEETFGCKAGLEFVAGRPDSPDTCVGDSGGPAFVVTAGARYLAGATSRATKNSAHLCGDGGIYSRLTPDVVAWLQTNGITIADATNK